jgi:hypothetical protein
VIIELMELFIYGTKFPSYLSGKDPGIENLSSGRFVSCLLFEASESSSSELADVYPTENATEGYG